MEKCILTSESPNNDLGIIVRKKNDTVKRPTPKQNGKAGKEGKDKIRESSEKRKGSVAKHANRTNSKMRNMLTRKNSKAKSQKKVLFDRSSSISPLKSQNRTSTPAKTDFDKDIVLNENEEKMRDITIDPLKSSPAAANEAAQDEGKYQRTERKESIDND